MFVENSMFVKTKTVALGMVAAAFVAAAPVHAAPVVTTSLADFDAAIGGATTTTDPFDNAILGGVSITFDSGVVSTIAGGNLSNASNENEVTRGSFFGDVDGDGSFSPLTLTWDFPAPVIGFGFDAFSIGIVDVRIGGSATFFDIFTEIGDDDGFFGIVDTAAPFTAIEFSAQGSLVNDVFIADNLIFATAPSVSVVPEPGALALFGVGLAGLGWMRRRHQRFRPLA